VAAKVDESGKASSPGSRRRLLLLGPNGYGTGPGTFEAALIHAAGWQNHLQAAGHRPLDLEALIQNPPDAILWTSPPGPALADRFARHRALARAVPDDRWLKTDYWRWQCPGPWSLDLIRQLNP
jgi:iron complex transport system substrate-binding protein